MKKFSTVFSLFMLLATAPIASAEEETPLQKLSLPKYKYSPVGKNDPFKPIVLSRANVQSENQLTDRDLADVRLVGTALGSEMSAVLMIGGVGMIARVGDKLGQKSGRIVSILSDRVIVRQPIVESNIPSSSETSGRRLKFEDVAITLSNGSNLPKGGNLSNSSTNHFPPPGTNTTGIFPGATSAK
jgi:Tfp pilus assembly protein PilP